MSEDGNVVSRIFVFVWRGVVGVITLPWTILKFIFGVRTPSITDAEKGSGGVPKGNELLTSEEIQMLRNTWQLLASDKKKHGMEIMIKLFTLYPASRQYFKFVVNFEPSALKQNKKMIGHATNFMYGVQTFVDNLTDLECLTELVKKLSDNHRRRSIGEQQFKYIAPVLCSYLHDVLGKDCTPFITSTWTKVLNTVAEIVRKQQATPESDPRPKGNELFSAVEIETLRSTWGLLAASKVQHGQNIFVKLFETYPEAKDFFSFKDIPVADLRGTRQLQAHVTTFMYGIQSFIDHVDDLETLAEAAKKVSTNHVSRGVGAKEFKMIEPVLFEYMDEVWEDKSSPYIKNTWSKLLNVLVDISGKVEEEKSKS